MRALITLFLLICAAHAFAEPGSVALERATLARMAALPIGEDMAVAAFPAGPGVLTRIRFKRIEVYAPGARIFVIDDAGQQEVPRSTDTQLLGYSDDGLVRVALTLDPTFTSAPQGAGSGTSGSFVVHAQRQGNLWRFSALNPRDILPDGVTPRFVANDDSLDNPEAQPMPLAHLAGATAPTGALRFATVAVDTDTNFMSERFAGNTSQATTWIASLFTQMNIGYERDVNVQLQQGTTFLRTASDPYNNTTFPADQTTLVEFGNYWQANYTGGAGNVSRDFAMLLSGNSTSGNSAAGIAWVNAYCLTSGSFGSYSINQIFTNSGIGVALSASLVAHELGHNFGAAHTHCSDATTGNYPVATNTIDQCSNLGNGCYAGATSCPVSGPGAPQGTLMSYCNLYNNGACGQNVLEFHPTHINLLNTRIAANTPGCLSLNSDLIFAHGFE
ncbi:MAG: hypothetical protein EYC71_13350 [Gammaproteobacteria bacterium]|nr:MAG: hypothetical protein EYC71_13350 [Gammaproteobacteria bacterium]